MMIVSRCHLATQQMHDTRTRISFHGTGSGLMSAAGSGALARNIKVWVDHVGHCTEIERYLNLNFLLMIKLVY